MASMTKRVNIRTYIPVRSLTPPIHGTYNNIIMSTGDILKCLCKRAIVDEILPDGSTVRLTMKNYYTDNGAGLDARKYMPVQPKEDIIQKNEVPEVPAHKMSEDQVVETEATSYHEEASEEISELADNAEEVTEVAEHETEDKTNENVEHVSKEETSEVPKHPKNNGKKKSKK